MTMWSRLLGWLAGGSPDVPLADRHARREAARARHRATDEPLWTEEDRHPDLDGEHLVADVTPGLAGHYGSVHSVKDHH